MADANISLYLDLAEGQKADLEVVARAALAFDAAVKELAYIIDPGAEIRVELESGTESSLSLNSVIRIARAVKDHPRLRNVTLKSIVTVILVWFAVDARTWGTAEILNFLTQSDTHAEALSQQDKQEIADTVEKAIREGIAKTHVQGVYRALERDPAVSAVGATTNRGERPGNLVPRSTFPERGGTNVTTQEIVERRVRTAPIHLTLVSPVLLPSATRRWRFVSSDGPISAKIKDLRFLSRLLTGQERVTMQANIEMDVILETVEDKVNGVWVPQERSILEVQRVYQSPIRRIPDLFARPSIEDDEDNC